MTESGRYIYMFKFINSMENCIFTVRRILRILEVIKGNKAGLSVPRTMRRHIESLMDPVVGARNIIEHLDDKIRENTIRENQSVMIKITSDQDGIMIGDSNLQFSTLSVLIKQMHGLGQDMLAWR